MSNAPAHRRSRFAVWRWPWWTWGLILPLLVLSYPLSVGPVVWLYHHNYLSQDLAEVIEWLYLPIILVAEQFEPAEDLLSWYVGWWRGR